MPQFICSRSITNVSMLISATVAAAPPTTAPAQPSPTDTKKTTVIRQDCGDKGTLVVDMRETRNGPDGRDIEYTYRLVPRGGGEPVDFGSEGYSDLTPFGSGEAYCFLIDAVLTSDKALVTIYGKKWKEGKKEGLYYQAYVKPADDSVLPWLNGISREVYEAVPPDPRRRPIITGSLKEGNLVLALEGPKDTLRFAYEFDGKREPGWHLLPAAATKPAAPAVAPANPPSKPIPKP
jgi:hypothetical protein